MKLRIDSGDTHYLLTTSGDNYEITSSATTVASAGSASVVELQPGRYSVLFSNGRSTVVDIVERGGTLEVDSGNSHFTLSVSDPRDRRGNSNNSGAKGPVEVRSQMPGKIIKVLVEEGQRVDAGEGLLIIEAMKMQNETKSPKDGIVQRIHVTEGSAVAAGAVLVLVE